ncbi:MAG TPA: GIDE domain-containing protein [Myxococcales bacterium]|jgi:hypothetical protein
MAAAAAIAAVILGLLALRAWQAQQVLKMKAGPLGTARPGGMVNVMGRVAPQDEVLTSPRAGKECVYYRTVVEVTTHGDEDHPSRTYVQSAEEDRVDFVIEDATGRVKVLVDGAHFVLEKDLVVGEKVGAAPRDHEVLGLQWKDHDTRSIRTEKETFIEIGDLVRVMGRAHGSAPRTDTDNPTMYLSKAGSPVFVVTDKPKGEVMEGYSSRFLGYAITAALMLGVAALCLGISQMPTPEEDPVPVDRTLKPLQRVKRPSAD